MKITTSLGKKRHEQLRSIAEILEANLFYIKEELDHHLDCDKGICVGGMKDHEKKIHKLRGYCEHLKVIASHMEEDGWIPATAKCLDCGERFEGEHQCKITYKL